MNVRRFILACSAVVAATLLAIPATAFASTGNSSETSHADTAAKGTQYCITVIAKINPPQPASRVVSRTCSTQHAPDSVLPKGVKVAATESELVTFYQNEDYTGNSNSVYGKNGICDGNGYGLSDLTYENQVVVGGISSYKTHSECWGQQYWDHTTGWDPWTTPCKTFTDTWEVPFVGAQCNDDLLSMYVWDNKV
jgi:hypothetical protein